MHCTTAPPASTMECPINHIPPQNLSKLHYFKCSRIYTHHQCSVDKLEKLVSRESLGGGGEHIGLRHAKRYPWQPCDQDPPMGHILQWCLEKDGPKKRVTWHFNLLPLPPPPKKKKKKKKTSQALSAPNTS